MKIAALVLGLLGSLVLVGAGATWASNWNTTRRTEMFKMVAKAADEGTADAETRELVATARAMGKAGNLAAALGIAAFFASLLAIKFPRFAGSVMAVAVVVPSVFAPRMALLGSLLATGALLALLAGRAKPVPPMQPAPVQS